MQTSACARIALSSSSRSLLVVQILCKVITSTDRDNLADNVEYQERVLALYAINGMTGMPRLAYLYGPPTMQFPSAQNDIICAA